MSELTHRYQESDSSFDETRRDRIIVLIGSFGHSGLDAEKVSMLPFALDLESSLADEVTVAPDELTDGQHVDFLFPASSHIEDNADRALDRVKSAIGSVGLANAEAKAVFAGPAVSRQIPANEAWHDMDEFTDRIYDHEQQESQLPSIPDTLNPHELF